MVFTLSCPNLSEITSGGKYRIWQDSEGTYLEISNVTAADAGTYMAGIDCDHGVGGGINGGKFVATVQKGNWDKTISSVKLYGFNDLFHTMNGALGGNMFGTIALYLSPFDLIHYLFQDM